MNHRKALKAVAYATVIFGVFLMGMRGVFGESESKTPASLVKVSLRLPIPVADTAFAPYYLAVDKGFFAKHGLDVKLELGSPELNPVKMVSQGLDQFGVLGGPELLFSGRAKGAKIVGIALIHKDADFVVILTLKKSQLDKLKIKKSEITRLDQLSGKKVGFYYGHISTDILRMLFKKNKINVQEVDVGFDYGRLLSGETDAHWAFRTTAGLNLPAKGVEINLISPAEHGIKTQGHILIANEDVIAKDPGLAQRFVNAVLEATIYSTTHVQEAIDATVKRDPNFKQSVGEQQLAIYNPLIIRNQRVGWISDKDIARTKKQMVEAGLLDKDFSIKPAYSTVFLEAFYKKKK